MGKKGYFIISSHQMPTEDSHWSDPTGGFHGKGSVTPHPLACQLERAVWRKLWCLVESHLTASPLGRFQQSSKLHKSIRPGLHWWGGGEGDWSKLCNFSYVNNLLLTYRGVSTMVIRLLPLPCQLCLHLSSSWSTGVNRRALRDRFITSWLDVINWSPLV